MMTDNNKGRVASSASQASESIRKLCERLNGYAGAGASDNVTPSSNNTEGNPIDLSNIELDADKVTSSLDNVPRGTEGENPSVPLNTEETSTPVSEPTPISDTESHNKAVDLSEVDLEDDDDDDIEVETIQTPQSTATVRPPAQSEQRVNQSEATVHVPTPISFGNNSSQQDIADNTPIGNNDTSASTSVPKTKANTVKSEINMSDGTNETRPSSSGITSIADYKPDSSVDFFYKDGRPPEQLKNLSFIERARGPKYVMQRKYRNFNRIIYSDFIAALGDNGNVTQKQFVQDITKVVFKETEIIYASSVYKKTVTMPITPEMGFYDFFDFADFFKKYRNLTYIEFGSDSIYNYYFKSNGDASKLYIIEPHLTILIINGKKYGRNSNELLIEDLKKLSAAQTEKEELDKALLKHANLKDTPKNRNTVNKLKNTRVKTSNARLNKMGKGNIFTGLMGIVSGITGLFGKLTGNYW